VSCGVFIARAGHVIAFPKPAGAALGFDIGQDRGGSDAAAVSLHDGSRPSMVIAYSPSVLVIYEAAHRLGWTVLSGPGARFRPADGTLIIGITSCAAMARASSPGTGYWFVGSGRDADDLFGQDLLEQLVLDRARECRLVPWTPGVTV
jgi:hypothetical protein